MFNKERERKSVRERERGSVCVSTANIEIQFTAIWHK